MGVDTISNQIYYIERDINNLKRDIQILENDIRTKTREEAAITNKLSKEKNIEKVTVISKDLARINEEMKELEKRKATKLKSLDDKLKKKKELHILLDRIS